MYFPWTLVCDCRSFDYFQWSLMYSTFDGYCHDVGDEVDDWDDSYYYVIYI